MPKIMVSRLGTDAALIGAAHWAARHARASLAAELDGLHVFA
jgi:hypothetical protein